MDVNSCRAGMFLALALDNRWRHLWLPDMFTRCC